MSRRGGQCHGRIKNPRLNALGSILSAVELHKTVYRSTQAECCSTEQNAESVATCVQCNTCLSEDTCCISSNTRAVVWLTLFLPISYELLGDPSRDSGERFLHWASHSVPQQPARSPLKRNNYKYNQQLVSHALSTTHASLLSVPRTASSTTEYHLAFCMRRRAHVHNSTDAARVQVVFGQSECNGCILVDILNAHVLVISQALADCLRIHFNLVLELRI